MFISFSRKDIQDFCKCRLLQDCCMGERVNINLRNRSMPNVYQLSQTWGHLFLHRLIYLILHRLILQKMCNCKSRRHYSENWRPLTDECWYQGGALVPDFVIPFLIYFLFLMTFQKPGKDGAKGSSPTPS